LTTLRARNAGIGHNDNIERFTIPWFRVNNQMTKAFVAVDLGAESGRVVALTLDKDASQFQLHEAHRFPTSTLSLPTGLHWDVGGTWREILNGLVLVAGWASENDCQVCSIGVDSWGVDWGMVDSHGELLGLPHAYRDNRNNSAFQAVTEQIPIDEIYKITGIQVMPINSLYSLFAMTSHSPELVGAADHLLFIPDLFHYFLTRKLTNEATIASTSQLLDIHTGQWADRLLEVCEVPRGIFSPPTQPGTVIGPLRKRVRRETGLPDDVQVVAPASHDTASAVAAIPADPETDWCFISSGTWSLLGAEIDQPCINDQAAAAMFTNEAGVAGTTRFLKNISGLWLVQQCRRAFAARGQTYNYAELTEVAELAEPFRTLIDPDHTPFAAPGKMLDKINHFANATGQPVPETPGDYLRCCLESLALAYRDTMESLQQALDRQFQVVHVVGGGGKNQLLNQMTADACGLPVVVGPIEATAIGNGLVQAMAMNQIQDLNHLRKIVGNTIKPKTYRPNKGDQWQQAYETFVQLRDLSKSIAE